MVLQALVQEEHVGEWELPAGWTLSWEASKAPPC